MGLDMYLSARRTFEVGSDDAASILAAAGITATQLKTMSEQDPCEHETYIYLSRWDHSPPEERRIAEAVTGAAGLTSLTTDESNGGELGYANEKIYVSVSSIYWRKANQVHSWFVQNCQQGIDECQLTPIHIEQLAALRSACEKALDAYRSGDLAGATTIMEPQSGFFFGSTDVDEWWAKDLMHTVSEIERVVKAAIEIGGVEFTYQSSW